MLCNDCQKLEICKGAALAGAQREKNVERVLEAPSGHDMRSEDDVVGGDGEANDNDAMGKQIK